MFMYEKNGRLNISFSNSSINNDISLYKDVNGPHIKVGNSYINGLDTLEDMNVTKLTDYLYSVDCNKYDYSIAEKFFSESGTVWGQCSSCRNGNFYGRNYDWTYDELSEFIVKVSARGSRHASVGVASGLKKLTNSFIESGENDSSYNLIPLMMLDGINDAGVVCNINVVPNDFGTTFGTNKGKPRINVVTLVRYILDNASSAENAIELLSEKDIWCPKRIGYEIHLMVADNEKTYCIEFINNQMKVLDLTNDTKIMTNFNLWDNGAVLHPTKRQDLTPHGSGYERYVILKDGLDLTDSVESMQELMWKVNFTKAYEEGTTPEWYSELVHDNLTNTSPDSDFAPIMERARELYKREPKVRDGKLWQTVHTSVYDISSLTLTVNCQENTTEEPFVFEVPINE